MNKNDLNMPDIHIGNITVFGPMFDIHDNQSVNFYGENQTKTKTKTKTTLRQAQGAQAQGATAADDKPMTLKYYRHGNNGLLMKQRNRVMLVFRKFNEWGWIDDKTKAEDFDALFEGEPRHCNITWTGNATILTLLLQELLKQPYIEKQTRCSAKSMVTRQFGLTANSDRNRLDGKAEERIMLALLILDVRNPLPEPRRGGNDEGPDIRDAALEAVYAGQLRMSKGV